MFFFQRGRWKKRGTCTLSSLRAASQNGLPAVKCLPAVQHRSLSKQQAARLNTVRDAAAGVAACAVLSSSCWRFCATGRAATLRRQAPPRDCRVCKSLGVRLSRRSAQVAG